MSEKKVVLVAEDERSIAKALELKLTHEGLKAVVAGDGQEALDWLDKNEADLILLDLMMPNVDGFATLEELKRRGSTVPVVVTSNLSQESDVKRAKDLGAIDFFVKSNMSVSDLIGYIKKKLE